MIGVEVRGNLNHALLLLKRRLEKDGIFRLIRIRDKWPKQSERRKAKDRKARLRREKEEMRRQRYRVDG